MRLFATSGLGAVAVAIAVAGCGSADGDEAEAAASLDLSKRARCFSIAKKRDGRPAGPAVPARPSRDPVEACARLWERGGVRIGTTNAPPLRACVGQSGRPLVVPNTKKNVCRKLGVEDPGYRPPAGKPGFKIDVVDDHDRREVRAHSRRFCSAGRKAVAKALDTRPLRRAVLRSLARGYPKATRSAARKGCAAGLRDAR